MSNMLELLEWLTRYGIIDIVFGLGIGGFIISALRNRTVKEIDGVQITIELIISEDPNLQHKTKLYFCIKNLGGKPLYLYKVSFRPYTRYFLWRNSPILAHIKTILAPRNTILAPKKPIQMSQKSQITTTKWYLPFIDKSPNGKNELPVFLNYGEQCNIFFSLSEEYSLNPERRKELEDREAKYNFGVLLFYCIQGASQITLKTNV